MGVFFFTILYVIFFRVVYFFCAFHNLPHDSGRILWFHIGRLCVGPSIHPFVIHPSACLSIFCFGTITYLSKYWRIFTKLGVCIDIVGVWFEIANGQISPIFDRVICPRHVHIFVSGQ